MAEYEALPRNATGDALHPCECGGVGRRKYNTFFHSVDFLDGCGPQGSREGGYDPGAGRAFKNKFERKAWQMQNGREDYGPENSWSNDQYLKDIRTAKADGVPIASVPHPHQTRWDAPAKERREASYATATAKATQYCRDKGIDMTTLEPD